MSTWTTIGGIAVAVAGTAFVGSLVTNWQSARQHRKETVAGAIRSALRRKEMYYRVRRRRADGSDDVALRDLFHDVQEENDQYASLLDIEAPWLGDAYRRFLSALKVELQPFMASAWAGNNAGGASVQLAGEGQPDVDQLARRFAQDGRRLFNPIMRPLMRTRYSLRKFLKEDKYGPK
jgi:hypothetical protein